MTQPSLRLFVLLFGEKGKTKRILELGAHPHSGRVSVATFSMSSCDRWRETACLRTLEVG